MSRTLESMSELEWLGWEQLGQRRLILRRRPGMARILRHLVQHPTAGLSADRLAQLGRCTMNDLSAPTIAVYMVYLREALADVGLEGPPREPRGEGNVAHYRLDPDAAAKIFAFILEGDT